MHDQRNLSCVTCHSAHSFRSSRAQLKTQTPYVCGDGRAVTEAVVSAIAMKFVFALLVGSFLNAGAASQALFDVRGVVRDTRGYPLPGVTITVTDREVTTVADRNGAFTIPGLPAGTYSVTASLIGFRSQTTVVAVGESSSAPLAFTLKPARLEIVDWVVLEPKEAFRRADAIAHLRIDGTVTPGPCGDVSIVSATHHAGVVAAWKGVLPPTILLAQAMAGTCFDGSAVVQGTEASYQPGEEYVVFLTGSGERYGRLAGRHQAFTVRRNWVHTRKFAGLPEFVTLAEFKTAIERLARED
jgi:hypothetical protein